MGPSGRVFTKQAQLEGSSSSGTLDPDAPLRFVASTEAVDRYGDIVRADGWELSNYKRNPVVLFGHSHSAPIGTAPKVWVERDERRLMAEVKLAAAGTSELVDSVRALVAQRVLRAVSVSFLPLEWKEIREKDRFVGYEFTRQELLELSLVSVPANQEALAVARSLRIPEELCARLFVPASRGMSAHRARVEFEKIAARG